MNRIVITACVLCIALSVAPSLAQPQTASRAREYRRPHEAQIIDEFVDLLSIPNVASDIGNMRPTAARVIEIMARRGTDARLREGSGRPAISSHLQPPDAPRPIRF